MGEYIYRVTAKIVDTPVGKANVAVFAYKPSFWRTEDNARAAFRSGCVASERMFDSGKPTKLVAIVDPDTGVIEAVFWNMKRMATFSDNLFGVAEYLPTFYTKQGGVYTFTAQRERGELVLHGRSYPIEPNGRWVVRNQLGQPVDCDQYQNDLTDRYPGLVVEQPVAA